jgi:hypothetical protein
MTSETSKSNDEERQLDITLGTVKRFLLMGYEHYNEAMRDGHHTVAGYWDGYIRCCQHILEAEGQ